MANSPPEKRRCMKGGKKVTVEENNEDGDMTEIAKNDGSDIEETSKNDVDNDDSLFLSQALDDEEHELSSDFFINSQIFDWIAPTQPEKTSLLSDTLRNLLKPFDEVPFPGDVRMLTQEINRLRKQLGDSLGEKQMLMYKVKNLNRENALLQDNLVQVQQTFEQRFIEQKNDFEKTERDMRNVITYQEQDLKTKEFRNRLYDSASVVTDRTEETENVSHDSPVIRLKKVSIPSSRRGTSFPRNLNDSILRKVFAHSKLTLNDTFRAIDSQGKAVGNATTFNQHDNDCSQINRIKQISSRPEIQYSNPNLYNCTVYLGSHNQLYQLYGLCNEMITLDFRSIVPEVIRNRKWKTIHRMHDVLAGPRKRWCR